MQSKLAKSITREISFEEENYEKDDISPQYLEKSGFTLKDTENSNEIELTKKVGNVDVRLFYKARVPRMTSGDLKSTKEPKSEPLVPPEEKGLEDETEHPDYCDFIAYIIQPDGMAMTFDCTAYGREVAINYIAMIDDVEAHRKELNPEKHNTYYFADFTTLDDRLQISMFEYLKTFDVDEELALFVSHNSLDKDQRLYMKWLENVKNFVEKPIE